MSDVTVSFIHPDVNNGNPLSIATGMNEIEWGYRLNTQRFPTYGGEVVQILSCFIDDLTVIGDVATYDKLESIAKYFVSYFQQVTQTGRFTIEPMRMLYHERNWNIAIRPKEFPGFQYGRDVVVPRWQLKAAVVEPEHEDDSGDISQYILGELEKRALDAKGLDMDAFAKLDATIGYIAENPFSNPFPNSKSFDKSKTNEALGELADYFTNLIPSYSQGNFPDLINDGSKPLFLRGGSGKDGTTTQNANVTGGGGSRRQVG
jgi:hypothetical protein